MNCYLPHTTQIQACSNELRKYLRLKPHLIEICGTLLHYDTGNFFIVCRFELKMQQGMEATQALLSLFLTLEQMVSFKQQSKMDS